MPIDQAPGNPIEERPRIASVDAYRGLVMFLMLAEVLHLGKVAESLPDNPFWYWLGRAQEHVEWSGCNLHDLIQPSFSFLVGTALALSLERRKQDGQGFASLWRHALVRSLALVLLGVFLRSVGRTQTRWTFEDTLSQIGLGYPLLFWIGLSRPKALWAWLAMVLVGYWAFFAQRTASIPGPASGVPDGWTHLFDGFASHWNKNANAAFDWDLWFLNLLPRETPFLYNDGGYATLSFIPTLGTMLLGLAAGRLLVNSVANPLRVLPALLKWSVVGLATGFLLDLTGVCPSVKRIWTPSWVLFSAGWCGLILSAFVWIIDRGGNRFRFSWLQTFGSNAIVAYVGSHLLHDLTEGIWKTHLGPEVLELFGQPFAPLVSGCLTLTLWFLALRWLERRRVFVRI